MKIALSIYLLTVIFAVTKCNANINNFRPDIYNGKKALAQCIKEVKGRSYTNAITTLRKFENEYHSSKYYPTSLILKSYLYYLTHNYVQTLLIVDDFLHQYPINRNASYVYYIKGMSNYKQIMDIGRDPKFAVIAKKDFKILNILYPYSPYTNNIQRKLAYISNILVGKDMEIARFYMRINKQILSANRLKSIIKKYRYSIFAPEALYRLLEIYYMLGAKNQACIITSVLSNNYSQSLWYYKSYKLLTKMKHTYYTEEYSKYK